MDDIRYPKKICYHYEQAADSDLKVAHGVWGGVTPNGEIEICFYDESDMPPESIEQDINPDGTQGAEKVVYKDGARHIRRRIHSRVLFNYNSAHAFMNWLDQRLGELDASSANEIYDGNNNLCQ